MTAHIVSSNTVLHFTGEELEEKGLLPPQLTYHQTLSLVHSIYEISDQRIPDHPDIEVFSSGEEVLIFVRPLCSESPQFTVTHSISS